MQDHDLCPTCGRANDCAMARGEATLLVLHDAARISREHDGGGVPLLLPCMSHTSHRR